ncbi:MAG: LysR family transcriptional regulator [Spirochaetales bacterium]|nr:LysR family transcriptional regulator [Spirochaetales bacterium]
MYYHLLNFKTVVDAGSINRASRILNLSQPALSKSIQNLEHYYQVGLLERNARGVRPTVSGNILYEAASQMEKAFLEGERMIQQEKLNSDPDSGPVIIEIGCSTIWMDVLLPEVMRTVDKEENFRIKVTNDTSEKLMDDLVDGNKYNFVLCRILENKSFKNMQYEPLLKSQVAVFTDKSHPLFEKGLENYDLRKLRWIKLKSLPSLRKNDLSEIGLSVLPDDLLPPPISFEVEDLMAAIQLLKNHYVILLPLDFSRLLNRYNIEPIPLPKSLANPYWLGMVHNKSRVVPLPVKMFMNQIRLFFA